MVQRRRSARFLLEPLQAFTIGRKRRRQDLDGHVAPQPGVAGAIDLAHPAGADKGGVPISYGPSRTPGERDMLWVKRRHYKRIIPRKTNPRLTFVRR